MKILPARVWFAAALVAGSLCPSLSADEYDTLRARWVGVLRGSDTFNPADTDFATALDGIETAVASNGSSRDPVTGTGYWDTLNTSVGRTSLWSDLASTSDSYHVTLSYRRLSAMALAWSAHGSSLQGNATLLADIIGGLDWMYANRYNETKTKYDNWWDWEIGAPIELNNSTSLLYAQLSAVQISDYMTAIEHFSPSPTTANGSTATGANRMWKCKVVGVRGLLVKDPAKLVSARDAMSSLFNYVTSGDGFYVDGSFIQHSKHPYNGSYGRSLLIDVADVLYLLNGSTWAVTDPDQVNVVNWLYDSFWPLIYRGEMMDAVRGRESARLIAPSHTSGRSVAGAFLRASQFAATTDATTIKRIVKSWLQTDTTFASQAGGFPLNATELAKAVLADSAISALSLGDYHQTFGSMDRVVQHRSTWAAALAMHSTRIYNFESINGENLKGWHTGDGLLYVYTADLQQFSGHFWPTVDAYRLPGTTVEATQTATQGQVGGGTVVGGVETWSGKSGIAAMFVSPAGRTLRGNKSWFFFDDEIICLGSGILATGGKTVESVIENRRLNSSGNNAFTVNGASALATLQAAPATATTLSGVNYAYLAGTVASGDGLGYYFPGGATLKGFRETRTGTWTGINTGLPDGTIRTNHFLTLWFDHGVNPSAGTYAYALLPAATAAFTASYASTPEFTVLENSTAAHAVKETTLNCVAAIFWADAIKTIGTGVDAITSDKKAAITTVKPSSANELQVTVGDPTQLNAGLITVTLGRNATGTIDKDSTVTILSLAPIKFTVAVSGAKGATQRVRFSL